MFSLDERDHVAHLLRLHFLHAILGLRMAHWVASFAYGLDEQVALIVRVGWDRVANYLT